MHIGQYSKKLDCERKYMLICNQPWEQLHVHLGGGVWFCCMRPSKTQRINYEALEKTDFLDIINSDEVVKLRDTFMHEEVPAFCRGCMMLRKFDNFESFAKAYHLEQYCAKTQDGSVDFTRLRSLKESYFELTTKCNFKCAYCLHSTPAFRDRISTISENVFFDTVEYMVKDLHLERISTTGIGEFTTMPNWQHIIDELTERYPMVELSMFSNFGRRLSDEELQTLLKVKQLNVSLDTVDAELFRRLRSGNIDVVIDNLRRLRQCAAQVGTNTTVSIASVVCDKNIFCLDQLVDFLAAEHLCEEITLTPMTLPASAANMLDIFPISMKFRFENDINKVRRTLEALEQQCKNYGIALSWSGDLQNYYTKK